MVCSGVHEAHMSRFPAILTAIPYTYLILLTTILSVGADAANNILQKFAGGTGLVIISLKGICLLGNLLLIRNIKHILIIVLFVFIASLRLFFNLIQENSFEFLDIVFLFRILLFFSFLCAFFEIKDTPSFDKIRKFLLVVLLIECIIIISAWIFHIDFFRAYQWRSGYKGIFVHINDEVFILLSGYLFLLTTFFYPITRRPFLFLICLTALSVMALGSRTALLAIFFVPLSFFFFRFFTVNVYKKFIYVFAVSSIILCLFALLHFYWFSILDLFLGQTVLVFEKTGNILTAITSGRDINIIYYIESLKNIDDVLFGSYISKLDIPSQMIESDLFDFLFRFGITGTIATFLLLFYLSKNDQGKIHYFAQAYLFSIFIIGLMTGHVLVSSENSPWIAFFIIHFSSFKAGVSANHEGGKKFFPSLHVFCGKK